MLFILILAGMGGHYPHCHHRFLSALGYSAPATASLIFPSLLALYKCTAIIQLYSLVQTDVAVGHLENIQPP